MNWLNSKTRPWLLIEKIGPWRRHPCGIQKLEDTTHLVCHGQSLFMCYAPPSEEQRTPKIIYLFFSPEKKKGECAESVNLHAVHSIIVYLIFFQTATPSQTQTSKNKKILELNHLVSSLATNDLRHTCQENSDNRR